MRKLSTPKRGQDLVAQARVPEAGGTLHSRRPALPELGLPPGFPAGPWEAEAEERQEAAASCPGAAGRAEREGRHTPSPAAATPGLRRRAGGPGRRLAPASLGRLPAPPRGGRQMGRPPAQRHRQETPAGLPGTWGRGQVGHARQGAGPRGRAQSRANRCEPLGLALPPTSWVSLSKSLSFSVPQFPY